jgi:hypothetical protein
MPVLDISDGSGKLHALAVSEILGVLSYPRPEKKAERLQSHACSFARLIEQLEGEARQELAKIGASLIPVLAASPPARTLDNTFGKRISDGWVAGEIILYQLTSARHHPDLDPTPMMLIRTLPGIVGSRTYSGSEVATSEDTLRAKWREYRQAASLHGAVLLWFDMHSTETTGPSAEDVLRLYNENMTWLLSTAEALRLEAEMRRFFKPGFLWSVPPDIPLEALQVNLPPFPEETLELLRAYRVR